MSLFFRLSIVAAVAVLLRCVHATVVITAPSTVTGSTAGLETREQGPTAWICSALAVNSPWISYANIRGYLEGGNAEKKDFSNFVLYPVMELFHASESRVCVYLPAEDHCYPPAPSTNQVMVVKQLSKLNYYAIRFWGQASDARVQYYKQKLTEAIKTQSKATNFDLFFVSFFSSHEREVRYDMEILKQSLKTKSGAIFRRKAVTDDVFACLAASGSQPLTAGNIQQCSEKAVVSGLKMFRWDGGKCTGYTEGIPVNIACCAGAGSVVLYSVDVEAKSPVVSNIKFAFSSGSTINATWDVTPNFCYFVAYRVSFYNKDTTVSDKLATVSFGTVASCAEYPLTVTPVDANSAVMGPAATVKVVMPPKARELILNLTHGVTAVKASWSVEYTCNPNIQSTTIPIASYSVTLGDQTQTTDDSTFEFTFKRNIKRCTDSASTLTADLNEVTCMALDDTGAQLGKVTATLTDNTMPGRRYYSPDNNCIFYQKLEETPGGVGFTFDQLQDFCQKTMFSKMFIGEIAVDTFVEDELAEWERLTGIVFDTPFFLGLKRNSITGKWMWLSGREMLVKDSDWDSGEPSSAGDCVEMRANKKVAAVSCNATHRATVCYDWI